MVEKYSSVATAIYNVIKQKNNKIYFSNVGLVGVGLHIREQF